MKHFLTILLLAVTTFAFGAERITIITNTGDKITGSFVTGSDKQITINIDGKEGIRVFNATEIQQFTLPDGRVMVSKDGQFVSQQKVQKPEAQKTEAYVSNYVLRQGNKYLLNGYLMDKHTFEDVLHATSPAAYNRFYNGHRTANIGWGLFGGGLGAEVVGGIFLAVGSINSAKGNAQATAAFSAVGSLFTSVGGGCVTAGIICIGVGYERMHSAADIYNIQVEIRNPNPTLSFNYTGTGASIAIAW